MARPWVGLSFTRLLALLYLDVSLGKYCQHFPRYLHHHRHQIRRDSPLALVWQLTESFKAELEQRPMLVQVLATLQAISSRQGLAHQSHCLHSHQNYRTWTLWVSFSVQLAWRQLFAPLRTCCFFQGLQQLMVSFASRVLRFQKIVA